MKEYRDIVLPRSTVEHGRIYFDAVDACFFPSDSIGDRGSSGVKGRAIKFIAGGETYSTDIRRSSSVRLSPRRSFGQFLKSVRAEEGGRLRIERVDSRTYRIEYIS